MGFKEIRSMLMDGEEELDAGQTTMESAALTFCSVVVVGIKENVEEEAVELVEEVEMEVEEKEGV